MCSERKKKFMISGTKTVWYKGVMIEAMTEEVAKAEYESALLEGYVDIREVDTNVEVDYEESE